MRSATGLVPRLPDGAQPHNPPPLALDIVVVNALGDTHWDATRQAAGAACLAYAQRKRAHNRTAGLCEAAGVRYLPLSGRRKVGARLRLGPLSTACAGQLLWSKGWIPEW